MIRSSEAICPPKRPSSIRLRSSRESRALKEPFPHDEFIYILSGDLLLTGTDGVERHYKAGDTLMVPKGFSGTWHQSENFRELVVIERKGYDAAYPSE
jgi:mannose-6-phosphate isomerase-like protein (cupin superfamily)